MTFALGERLEKPVVSGSDTQQAVQDGCVYTEFEQDLRTIAGLYREMQAGRYRITVSDQAAFQVKTAGILKRALKEIHALGGDYVQVLLSDGKEKDGPSFSERIAVHYQTTVIDYSPQADRMAQKLAQAANEMAWKGYELISVTATPSAKAILVFRRKSLG